MDFEIMRASHGWKCMLAINNYSITHITICTDLQEPLNNRALTNMKTTHPILKL